MKELVDTLAAWRIEGIEAGRAVVVRTFGSSPRPEGAVLLLASDGRIAGSVSGGCVEGAAAEQIERARATGHSRVIRYGISDEQAWDVGLACGGTRGGGAGAGRRGGPGTGRSRPCGDHAASRRLAGSGPRTARARRRGAAGPGPGGVG